jgi:hypothetical protein
VQTINRPSRDAAQAVAFSWIDTKEVRPPDSCAFAFLNDSEQRPSSTVLDALQSYEVKPILWSEREAIKEHLAA